MHEPWEVSYGKTGCNSRGWGTGNVYFHHHVQKDSDNHADSCITGTLGTSSRDKDCRSAKSITNFICYRCWTSATLKMETMISAYKSTWCYNPKDQHRHLHSRENLKSDILHSRENLKSDIFTAVKTSNPTSSQPWEPQIRHLHSRENLKSHFHLLSTS
jgi:hypothetical protein